MIIRPKRKQLLALLRSRSQITHPRKMKSLKVKLQRKHQYQLRKMLQFLLIEKRHLNQVLIKMKFPLLERVIDRRNLC